MSPMTPRQRLLKAAIHCLQEQGWARTTTRQIVARAGMHVPSVNYYFGSKDRLLHDAAVEALRRWTATTMDAVDPSPEDPGGELRRSVERFLDTLDADRPYVVAAVEAFAQAERSDELRGRLADAYATFRSLVVERIQPGATETETRTSGALPLASVLIALFDGLAIQRLIAPNDMLGADEVLAGLAALSQITSRPEPEEVRAGRVSPSSAPDPPSCGRASAGPP